MNSAANRLARRELLALVAAWAALWIVWALMAPYGLDPSDEGYIVYPAVQVTQGAVPYRDINSLYTPLAWYLNAGLFQLVGVELIALRVFWAAFAAALAVGTYLLVRQVASPFFAAVAFAAFALVMPIPQVWAPYPAWYALLGLMIGLLGLSRWLRAQSVTDTLASERWLALTGVGAAIAFGTKPSLGLFGLLAIGGFIFLRARSLTPSAVGVSAGAGRLLTLLQLAFVVAVPIAFWLLIHPAATGGNQLLLLSTTVVAMLVLIEGPGPVEPARIGGAILRRALWIGVPFLLVTACWLVPIASLAGGELVLDTIFRAGARTVAAFYEPVFVPNRDAFEALAWIVLGAIAAFGLAIASSRGRLTRRFWLTAAGLVVFAIAAFAIWRAAAGGQSAIDYLLTNVLNRANRTAIEEDDLLPYIPFLAIWATVALLAYQQLRGEDRTFRWQWAGLLTLFCAVMLFQLYPRASYRHVLFGIAPFLALFAMLQAQVWRYVAPRLTRPGPRVVAAVMLLVFPLVMVPTAWRARAETLALNALVDLPHARVFASSVDQERLAFVADTIRDLPPGEPVFAYPALPMVYLLTDHPNPTRESYLPAGYLDEPRLHDVVDRLERTRTRYVVWDQNLVARVGLTEADRIVADYLFSHYQPIGSKHGWIVLERLA